MAGLGLAGGFGAAGAADALRELLARRFMEQVTRQRLAQDQAEMEQRREIAMRQLSQGDRRIGLDESEFGFRKERAGVEDQRYATEAPVRLDFTKAQTANLNREPQEQEAARAHAERLIRLREESEMRMLPQQTQAQLRVAMARAANAGTGAANKIWITRGGQPMFVPEGDVRPGDMPHQRETSTRDTAQDRQRQGRLAAARGFLQRLNELRQKINTKMGPQAGIGGAIRQGKAAIGMDPDVAEYERERAAGGRALAVAVMGAQNLSDADAKAWADMLPGARVDEQTAQRLMVQIERMLDDTTSAGSVNADIAKPAGSKIKSITEIK